MDSRALVALTARLREVGSPVRSQLDRGLDAVRARLAARRQRFPTVLRFSLLGGAALLCVALGLVVWTLRASPRASEPPVAIDRVEGGRLLEGGYLSESGGGGIQLFFDDGSKFVLMPGTRGRLRPITEEGAHLAIERGTGSFEINPSRERRWSVEAGPFLVAVQGTNFEIDWEPANEQFELRLRRGRVTVSGPVVGENLALRAGQKLSVSLPKGVSVISEDRPAPSEGESAAPDASSARIAPATPALSASDEQRASAGPAPLSSGATAELRADRRWKDALASGRWDQILAEVERDGVDSTLQNASSEDLFALADAARYRRRVDLARAALLSQRRRFPGSPRSLDALFLLGRVEELRGSGRAKAIGWYDDYLSRAPAGTYAAEALGRKMVLSNEVGGPASARAIAGEYLRRFPDGSYAGAARTLQRVP
jgi:TolA-binding protein